MTLPNKRWLGIAALLILALTYGCGDSSETERLYFSVAMDGRTYGYQETVISRTEHEGQPVILITERGRGLVSALGAKINSQTSAEYKLDPDTWQLVSAESVVDQGSLKLRISASVEGNRARIRIDPGGGEKEVVLEPGVIFENPIFFQHLLEDFGDGSTETKRYRVLELLDRKVWDVIYTRRGTEEIELGGRSFRAIVLDSLVPDIGLKLRLWIDAANGNFLKLETPQSVVARADKSVRRGLARANYDSHIFARAGARIEDIEAISILKARAALEPVGNRITAESLNVPGQRFVGTVVDNRIEGVFDVRHPRYNGRNAPAFPPGFGGRPELEPYLSPEDFIESDDPVLVRKAAELAEGAGDSWEAAKRLSRWVADNIGYDIPGGASARNTYDIREGECGAHSRLLAAFCRAAGIPARVVWGCMYVPNNGGSFGQHAWNEVYMGEAGWVPLDTTAREVDFADSGHIRLGILSSAHVAWNPEAMQILDFQAGPQRFGKASERGESPDYEPYLGKFSGPRGVITVFTQDGGLSLKLADGRTFGLRNPDEEGKWVFKLSRDVNVLFERAGSGRITGLILNNRVRIPKRAAPQEIPEDVPTDLRPCLGQYPIPMDKQEISIVYRTGGLVMLFPGRRQGRLDGPDENGLWLDKSSGDRYSFVRDEDGTVRALILHEKIRCTRVK
jgi:transglutaminase-like putative cysteine protease